MFPHVPAEDMKEHEGLVPSHLGFPVGLLQPLEGKPPAPVPSWFPRNGNTYLPGQHAVQVRTGCRRRLLWGSWVLRGPAGATPGWAVWVLGQQILEGAPGYMPTAWQILWAAGQGLRGPGGSHCAQKMDRCFWGAAERAQPGVRSWGFCKLEESTELSLGPACFL